MICSSFWRDLSIDETKQEISHCPKQNRYPISLQEIKTYGTDIFYKNNHFLKSKRQMIGKGWESCELCRNCNANVFNTRNIWKKNPQEKPERPAPTEFEYYNNDADDTVYLYQIDYIFSPVCNQTCMYCNSNRSNQWAKLLNNTININEQWNDAMIETLLLFLKKAIPKNYNQQGICINFLGGEPFLNLKSILKLCTPIAELGYDLRIKVTSNLNIRTELLEQFINFAIKYPNIRFFLAPSIDALNSKAEGIRTGLDFNLFMKNLEFAVKSNAFKRIVIIPTMSALNIKGCKDFFKYFVEFFENNNWEMFNFATNPVLRPKPMAVNILPEKYKEYFIEGIEYLEYKNTGEPKKLKFILDNIGTDRSDENLKKYRIWYEEHGKLKNLDYFNIFPELEDILKINNA